MLLQQFFTIVTATAVFATKSALCLTDNYLAADAHNLN